MSIEIEKNKKSNIKNDKLIRCIKLFSELTPEDRLQVMYRTCPNCGNTIENWICNKCDN